MKRPNLVFVLWVLFGFTLLFFITPRLFIHRGGKSPELLLILFSVVPLVWLIGGIVLGVICFRKSKQVGKWFYGVLGVLLFFFVADSFFGVSQQIRNIGRKDEFARIYEGAPECHIHIALQSQNEVKSFNKTMRTFAAANSIRECRNKFYRAYSGPPPCAFKGEHVAIWGGAGSTGIDKYNAHLRLAPFDEKYSTNDFEVLADSLINELKVSFGNRVDVTLKRPEGRAL